jgi:hypothetical protein
MSGEDKLIFENYAEQLIVSFGVFYYTPNVKRIFG